MIPKPMSGRSRRRRVEPRLLIKKSQKKRGWLVAERAPKVGLSLQLRLWVAKGSKG